MTRVAVVGPGRLGTLLATAATRAGHRVVAVAGGTAAARTAVAGHVAGCRPVDDLAAAAERGELLLLAVPGDAVAAVVRELARADALGEHHRLVHLAPDHGLAPLELAARAGCGVAALHPVVRVPAGTTDPDHLVGAAWAVTARPADRAWAQALVTDLGGDPHPVAEDRRVLYAAGVTAARDGVAAAAVTARRLLLAAGVEQPAALLTGLGEAALATGLAHGGSALDAAGPAHGRPAPHAAGPARGRPAPDAADGHEPNVVDHHLDVLDADAPPLADAYRQVLELVRRAAEPAPGPGHRAVDPAPGSDRSAGYGAAPRPAPSDAREAPVTDDRPDEPDPGEPEVDDAAQDASKLAEIVATRRTKIEQLRASGIDPYPVRFRPTHTLAAVRETHDGLEAGTETGEQVTVAGRLVGRRELGRLTFLVLREDGVDLQLFCPVKALDEPSRQLLEHLDIGDWLGASGEVLATKTGELSVRPDRLTLLGKGLRPLPKWHGLSDTEIRYRQRELDLTVNADARRVFELRPKVLAALRQEMTERGFVEVETPILHPIPGGAAAKPFVTHHNALDEQLYLRIAPELYLKRLVAGGMPRVFELGRVFRNEGISPRHNPEFTILESYAAYDDYYDVMELTEALLQRAAVEALGTLELSFQGREVSLAGPYRRVTLLELVREATGEPDLSYDHHLDDLRALCERHGVAHSDDWGPGKLMLELYEALVEHTLWEPTFVLDYPVEVSPLARRHRSEPHVTERFELIVTGREFANAFSELTDPDDQRERLEQQAAAKAAGDEEAMAVDEPYLRAMELGLPPTGGLGVGVDRLVMLLADVANIRDAVLFPTLRPER